MSPFRSPLYWQLLVWFCVANLLVLVLGGFLARRFIDFSTATEVDWTTLAQEAEHAYDEGGSAALAEWIAEQRQDGIEATLYQNGRELEHARMPPPVRRALPGWLAAGHDLLVQPWPGAYVSVQKIAGGAGESRQFVAYSRMHTRLSRRRRAEILLGVELLLSLLVIGTIGWWVARSVARPVEALRDATRRMAAGELSTRIEPRWSGAPNELGQLAQDFNGMASRIEALVAHERSVLQDLSHELRSPLARLHVILELLRRGSGTQEGPTRLREAEREITRLDRITGEMLALSRLESGLPGTQREPFDLSALLDECIATPRVAADARGVRLTWHAERPLIVTGERSLMRRAIENLVGNAIKFSPAGSAVEATARMEGDFAIVEVRDHGPGVPEAELDSLFRPFFRGSNAARAEGHGLGLAIVQRVASAHGGHVRAANVEGGGLRVTLRLPRAGAQDNTAGSGNEG